MNFRITTSRNRRVCHHMDNIGNEQYQKIIQDFPELKGIVKLANTELTPENSTCTRGLWLAKELLMRILWLRS